MKKIIAAFDGLKYSTCTRDYAVEIAKQSDAHLVGVFLDDATYTSYKIYELLADQGISESKLKKYEAKDKLTRKSASADFENACQKASLQYTIHHDHNIAINELKHESIYADLLIIDAKETLTHYDEKPPTRFIRDLLGDVQCPVVLINQKYKPIEKIVMLYDGEPSSVHAVKMFSYTMPYLKDQALAEIISVKKPGSTLHVPDYNLMKEYMKRHYAKAVYTVLKGLAEEEIVSLLKEEKQQIMVVLGAYRRGMVSRWFRESMADILMRELKMPLFVAHNK